MKLGLINPRGAFFSNNDSIGSAWKNSAVANSTIRFYTCPNLGLLTVASIAQSVFDDIKYIDENYQTIDYDEKFDVVAISAMTNQINRAYSISDEFRRRGIKVVIGGVHASVLPEEAKMHADSVFEGEAEKLWPKFMEDLLRGEIRPHYKSEQEVDVSTAPIPRFDLLDIKNHKIVPIQTSRGCPHKCEFCSSSTIFGTKFRFKKVEQVVKEIEALKKVWNRPYIYFADDNMTANRKYAKELMKAIIPLKIRWQGYSDIAVAQDEELLELLYKSGCTHLLIGLESLSYDNLGIIESWKANQLDKYTTNIEKIQSHGIGVFGSFILGLDNDTTSVFQNLRNFILDNNLFGAIITVQTPLPGTRLYDRIKKDNRILNYNWDYYTLFDVVCKPVNMSVEELEEGFAWVYKEIYSLEAVKKRSMHFKNIISKLKY
jgi:radical SAM superfamily enzyme YgiQ (UPF0313 family)